MKTLIPMLAVATLLAVAPRAVRAGDVTDEQKRAAAAAVGSVNGVCPVMGRLVTPTGGSAVYEGEKIAFCCPGCVAKFTADPVRYMNRLRLNPPKYWYASAKPAVVQMRAAKEQVGSANGRCPVMGKVVVSKGGSSTYKGQRIAFCCPPCKAKFEKDPERYMRLMRADPIAYAYDRPGPTHAQLRVAREAVKASNGLCPVMGRLVTPTGGAVTHDGERIAFCCPGCAEKFQADAAGYMARVRAEPAVYGFQSQAGK